MFLENAQLNYEIKSVHILIVERNGKYLSNNFKCCIYEPVDKMKEGLRQTVDICYFASIYAKV